MNVKHKNIKGKGRKVLCSFETKYTWQKKLEELQGSTFLIASLLFLHVQHEITKWGAPTQP
jgi:hypothetical protein